MIRVEVRRVLSRVLRLLLLTIGIAACGEMHRRPPPTSEPAIAARLDGKPVKLGIDGQRILQIEPAAADEVSTRILWPSIIDSHVHVTYWPVADKLATTGIGTVVDLAAPESSLGSKFPLRVIAAGPMLTRPDGYPLDSWGADGYGIACEDEACVRRTIDRLASKGARVVKLAMNANGLSPALVKPAIDHAHGKGLKVAVHALEDRAALLAGEAGADLLAHTPVEPLSAATIEAWRGKAVVSTLAAFRAPDAPDNLKKLRAAGCTVLYGTDLGNLRDAGPSAEEVQLLRQAGLDDAAITAAMTTAPAVFWGIPSTLVAGNDASFLLLDRDPRTDASVLLDPHGVWLLGRRVR